MEKSCKKCAPTVLHARNSFKNKDILKGNCQKPLKNLTYFFFRTHSLLIDKVINKKRGLELVTSRSSGYETSPQNFSISYILSDQT